jgi:hypothetical protein
VPPRCCRRTREDLDSLEAALLYAARRPGARTGGKSLLTFRQIAAAIGTESEQAAQGRYRRKVGNLNGSDSGNDGTPDLQPTPGSGHRCRPLPSRHPEPRSPLDDPKGRSRDFSGR